MNSTLHNYPSHHGNGITFSQDLRGNNLRDPWEKKKKAHKKVHARKKELWIFIVSSIFKDHSSSESCSKFFSQESCFLHTFKSFNNLSPQSNEQPETSWILIRSLKLYGEYSMFYSCWKTDWFLSINFSLPHNLFPKCYALLSLPKADITTKTETTGQSVLFPWNSTMDVVNTKYPFNINERPHLCPCLLLCH